MFTRKEISLLGLYMKTGSGPQAKWVGVVLTACAIALFGACQGGSNLGTHTPTPPTQTKITTLQELLADLDGLSAPADVDLQLFEELKASLAAALAGFGEARFVSSAPQSDLSAVTDFSVQPNADNSASLSWTYKNQGDYDQNGEVNISDLTPIVVNFGASPAGTNWANKSVADGDENGEVNLSDITPIAMNYSRTVGGYRLFSTATQFDENSWVAVADVEFTVGEVPGGLSRRAFEYELPNPQDGNYYRVAPFHAGEVGPMSNSQRFASPAIPGAPQDFTATQGTLIDEVYLSWLPLDGAAWYIVQRRIGQVGAFEELGSTLPGQTEYRNILVTAGEVYQYLVKGVNGSRESGYSSMVEGWPMRTPGAPQNLDASDGTSSTSVELSWDGDSEAAEYVIYRSPESGTGHTEIDRTSELSYSDTSATTEFIYYYQVASENAVGESGPSNEDDGWLDGYVFPPVVDSVDPTSGSEGSSTTFSATTSGGAVETYSWDFGGGATPDNPTGASPTVTLGAVGTYDASLTVANLRGENTFDFELTVGTSQWVHTWGTPENDVSQGLGVDDDGNVYVVGRPGNQDTTTLNSVKLNSSGEFVWAKTISPFAIPWTFAAEVDGSGNIYIATGSIYSSGFSITKQDTDGQIEWQRYFPAYPLNRAHITVDSSGMVYFCGDADDIGGNGFNFILMKFNPSGELQWQNYIKSNSKEGGSGDDYSMTALITDDANNLYIIAAEGKILKIDSDGIGIWQKAWRTGGIHEHAYTAYVDSTGNIYLGGDAYGSGGDDYRAFVVKFDPTGALQFQTGIELDGVDISDPGFDYIYLDENQNLWGMISSLRFMGTPDDSISHLLRLDQTGDVTGHWSINNTGSMPAFWDFEISSDGDLYFGGIDADNQSIWETATHTMIPFVGQVNDEPYEIIPAAITLEQPLGSSSNINGTLDTGGGGSDMLLIKLDPASLP